MNIIIEDGEWGNASKAKIKQLLEKTAAQIMRNFSGLIVNVIRIKQNLTEDSPMVLYRKSKDDDYIIHLNVRDDYWCQFIFQFSHELCHIISDFERLRSTNNQWFHESICELNSIFTLKNLAFTWKIEPLINIGPQYADSIHKYVCERLEYGNLPESVSFMEWFNENEQELQKDPYKRKCNTIVAVQLLPIFLSDPKQWGCIQYFPNEDVQFGEYLNLWFQSCPSQYKKKL